MPGSEVERNETWDQETDVVIVGAGDAGLATAIASLEAGSGAIVFEKMASVKSTSSAMAGGAWAFAGTELQRQHGVQDSNELFFEDLMRAGKGKNYEPLVRVFLREQLDAFNWMTALGVKWTKLRPAGGGSVLRAHYADPLGHIEALKQAAEMRGAKIYFKTKVTELITDSDNRVIGVCTASERGAARVKASKGVVLATGGFGYDKQRMASIGPGFDKVKVIVSPGHTGDGHRMAEMLGGCFRHMEPEYLKPTIGVHASGRSHMTNMHAFWDGAILVNKLGNRFVNESLENRSLGSATVQQPDQVVFEIFDQKVMDRMKSGAGRPVTEASLKKLIAAATIDELASKIGIPGDALKRTIERYNAGVKNGKDADFGRTHLTQVGGEMTTIDAPMFYAFETAPWMPGTYGGLAVDEDMHVLTKDGIIPGLYAAGEIVGGFHGAGHHIGSALPKAVVFGRIAGRNCAAGR